MAKNMVTISLEEYKELLLKERPTDNDKELLERIFNIIEPSLEYTDSSWDSIMKNVRLKDSDGVIKEIFKMIKYVDFERYMAIWNGVQTKHRKEEEQKMMIEQMNNAKDMREENNE